MIHFNMKIKRIELDRGVVRRRSWPQSPKRRLRQEVIRPLDKRRRIDERESLVRLHAHIHVLVRVRRRLLCPWELRLVPSFKKYSERELN